MADQGSVTEWPVELIPDTDRLFMRVHRTWLKSNGSIGLGAFQNHGNGMSVDWSRYASPEDTRERARVPGDNAVIQLIAGRVRELPGQSVEHTPLPDNRAHSDVTGEKDEEVRVKLGRIAEWLLRIEGASARPRL